MNKIVKITDVAERAGVAKSTVSNVLSGKKFVSEELRKKVLEACEELDFHPNFYASALSGHKSNIIALLLESDEEIGKRFYQNIMASCLKQASERGYSLLIYYNPDKEKLLSALRQGMAPIDGAIIMSPCINDERLTQMESGLISCVVIGRPENKLKINYVDINNYKLVKDVTEKLVQSYGKDIYLINSDRFLTISQDRSKAFKDVLKANGITADNRIFESMRGNAEEGYAISKAVLKKDSVFITANGHIAEGIYRAAEEKGLKIGRDVGVFALGRSIEHGSFTPKLSYADQDYGLLGKTAADILLNEIEHGFKKNCVLIESNIIYTQSVEKD